MVTQLNPPLPMSCPKGEGIAHFLIDYGPESDIYWTIFITETGEVWTYANKHVRASKNITLGRTLKSGEPGSVEATVSEYADSGTAAMSNAVRYVPPQL